MPDRAALLVIDMQETVLAHCADVPGVIERINDLLGRARQSGAPIVFIQHEDPEAPELSPDSPGWQLVAGLDRREGCFATLQPGRSTEVATAADVAL